MRVNTVPLALSLPEPPARVCREKHRAWYQAFQLRDGQLLWSLAPDLLWLLVNDTYKPTA